MSKIQKEYLVSYFEENRFLLETKINPSNLEKYKTKWNELVNKLNTIEGAKKTVNQWKDVSISHVILMRIRFCG